MIYEDKWEEEEGKGRECNIDVIRKSSLRWLCRVVKRVDERLTERGFKEQVERRESRRRQSEMERLIIL